MRPSSCHTPIYRRCRRIKTHERAHAARRYFLHSWPKLCWLAFDGQRCFGVVVCKADDHRGSLRGYIAMLVVQDAYRGLGVGEAASEPRMHRLHHRPSLPMLPCSLGDACMNACNNAYSFQGSHAASETNAATVNLLGGVCTFRAHYLRE